MKKKQIPNSPLDDKETPKEIDNENEIPLEDGSDICQQLMDRYSKSSAPQHRHLIATAAAMRSILSSESLPLSPPAYFAASISALDDDSAATLDSTAIGALLTFLSLVVPAVPKGGIASGKAKEAVEVVVRVLGKEGLGVASLRSGVKCLGLLLVGFSDLQDWHSVQFGLESLLGFAIDKRPKHHFIVFWSSMNNHALEGKLLKSHMGFDKRLFLSINAMNQGFKQLAFPFVLEIVRRCAQEYLEKFFKSLQSSDVMKEASKLVLSLLKSHMPVALTLNTIKSADDSKDETLSNPEHLELQNCVGSAVTVIGPERMLTLLPITLSVDNLMHSNMWLVPILKDYVVGASLSYYMEHIVPLAKSFQEASCKGQGFSQHYDPEAHSHSLWGLLPAFCRYPIDTHKRFKALAELLIDILKEDSLMHENIAVAIQILVNQNKNILRSGEDADESNNTVMGDSKLELRIPDTYSKKTATKNIKALSSCAPEILQALTDVFIHSIPAKRLYLKDAIGCLASITDSSITKRIFVSLVEKLQSIDGEGEFVKQAGNADEVVEKEKNTNTMGKDASRCIIMELASSLISGAEEDLIDFIYVLIKQTFQETNEIGHHEAYYALSKILEEHAWFCSSKSEELIDLLLGLKSPADTPSLRNRLDCFNTLMVHTLKVSSLEENTKPFLILNEIIVTLKDGKEETRKTTYDILLKMSSTLRKSSDLESDPPYHKLISMIMGYLSGSSPHIKSGAVAALSVLVYDDPEICISVPDLVSSILSLLQTKAVEVIKAVLGFVKVLVSTLQAKDLQNFLSDIINGVLQWSSISRNHFRSKVTIILEILTRKCGIAAVQSVAPEKHKGFLNTVIENRRGKTTSEETDVNDADKVPVGSSTEGSRKRRDKRFGAFKSKNDMIEHRKRKRDKRDGGSKHAKSSEHVGHGGGMKMAKRAKHLGNSMKDHSEGNGKKKNFDKGSSTGRGQKRKINQATTSQKGEAAGDKRHSFKVQTRPKKFRGVNKKGDK
ncbi:hypothetical protein GOBAR_AA19619 [Gossypium barbadense]|uniref:Uncharacterized protein n=1 Tax=Gossypium barbadense TaxID=3634 RepID=A0A2P5XCG9_GOSBA|nr:hypothetical protein GOBAR_AA19619 [Gossypium barbadense]